MSSPPPSGSPSLGLGHRVVRALSVAHSVAEGTQRVLRELAEAFDGSLAILWLLEEESNLLRWGEDWSDRPELDGFREVCRRLTFTPGVGLPGRVLATLEPIAIDAVDSKEQFPRAEAAAEAGLDSAVAAPVLAPEGAVGVVEIFAPSADAVRPEPVEELAIAARQLGAYLGQIRVEERLRAAEESSASIFAAALDCVITMDDSGRILDFNPAAEATFGYARQEVVGEVLAQRIIPPELRDAHHRALRSYLHDRAPTILNRRLELTGMRADGTTFPVELTVTRVGSGEPPTFAGFIRDITERHQAEIERDRLLAEAISARAHAEAAEQRAAAARAAAERAHAEADAAGRRLALLAAASERMLTIRDAADASQQVVGVAVPALADWGAVVLTEPGGGFSAAAARTRLIDPVTEADLHGLTQEPARLQELAKLRPTAILSVPLRAPWRVLGTITLAMTASGRSFEPEDIRMVESLASRAALAIENARLFRERSHIADTLQRSLLPPRLPDVEGIDVAARYRAAGEQNLVGGDFYDVFRSGDGVWTAVLGDVAGKGPEAAAVTALTRHTLRAAALRASSPAASLSLLNQALLASRDERVALFATVVYARICRSPDGALITVSVGGHPPPLIARAGGGLEVVAVRGTILGALEPVELTEVDVPLFPGDVMLLYTDGVTEVRTDDAQYGERLLRRTLREHAGAGAQAIVTAVEHAAVSAQDGEPRDDIALIALRVKER